MVVKQFQDGGRPPFWKSLYRHISVKNHPISMKFCTQQQILNWMNVTWSKKKKLHWADSEFNNTYFLFSVISAEKQACPQLLVSPITPGDPSSFLRFGVLVKRWWRFISYSRTDGNRAWKVSTRTVHDYFHTFTPLQAVHSVPLSWWLSRALVDPSIHSVVPRWLAVWLSGNALLRHVRPG